MCIFYEFDINARSRGNISMCTWVRGNIWHKHCSEKCIKKSAGNQRNVGANGWSLKNLKKKKQICWQIFSRTLARVPSAQKNGLLPSFFFLHSFLRWHIRIKYVRAPRSRLHSTICFSRLRMCSCFVYSPIVKEAHIGRLLPCLVQKDDENVTFSFNVFFFFFSSSSLISNVVIYSFVFG